MGKLYLSIGVCLTIALASFASYQIGLADGKSKATVTFATEKTVEAQHETARWANRPRDAHAAADRLRERAKAKRDAFIHART